MTYDAFISYSHAADGSLAPALQSGLHRFAKPWYKLRAMHIFRDQTNLAVNPGLWSSIRDALDRSSFFVLLASPEAAASPWVAKEAEYWLAGKGLSHFLIVLTRGTLEWDRAAGCFRPESTNALPPTLCNSFPEEPLYLDLRWAHEPGVRLRLREPRFHEAVLQLDATLRNKPKDELDGADIRYRRHARVLALCGLAAVFFTALVAMRQTRVSHEESRQNLAASLAAESNKVLADSPDRAREAALLAIESDRLNPSFESNQALRAAVSLLPAGAQFYKADESNPEERVRDIALSPSGSWVAVARDDGSTQLIDLKSHKKAGYLQPDEKPGAVIEFSGNGKDASPDDNSAVSVAFDGSGAMLASGSRDGLVHVWAVPGGRELLRIRHAAPVSQVAFRPSNNQLLTADLNGHLRTFDLPRAAVVIDVKLPDRIAAAAFSPGGDLVAALSSEGGISVIDPTRGKVVRTMAGGEAGFNLAFSKDGKRLATSNGTFAFVWDLTTGRQLLRATHSAASEALNPQQWIVSAAISADGRFLAYAARADKSVRVWEVESGRQVLEVRHDSAVAAVAFDKDTTRLGTGSYDGTARVWEFPSGRETERLPHAGGAEVVVFSPDGNQFAAGGMDGSVSISEARRADRPAYFATPAEVRSVAFSPDGRRVAIGTTAHASPLVEVADASGNLVCSIGFHGAPMIDRLVFTDSKHLIAQWADRLFRIDVDRASAIQLPETPGQKRIDPSGNVLAVQNDESTRLYTLPGLQETGSLNNPSSSLLGIVNQGRLLAFEASDAPNDIDLWDVVASARVCRISAPAELTRLALHPAGNVLFTAESENLQGWDIPSGRRRFSLTASDDIDLIVPDPSSAAFATVTHGRLTVWSALTGVRLAQLPDAGYIRVAAFSPDGRYVLTGYDEHSAAVWLWRSGELRDQACSRLTSNLTHAEWARWVSGESYRRICANLPAGN